MNKRADNIYAAIVDNEIICLNTTLTKFHSDLKTKGVDVKGYMTFFRAFSTTDRFAKTIDGKECWFQRYPPKQDTT